MNGSLTLQGMMDGGEAIKKGKGLGFQSGKDKQRGE